MYKKGSAVEIQFSPERLNDTAGDPYWIDLTVDEARVFLRALQAKLAEPEPASRGPVVLSLDGILVEKTAPSLPASAVMAADVPALGEFNQWVCVICGWVYDEATGWPDDDIAPGTRWEDVPSDWRCPLCDVSKDDFAMVVF